MAIDPILLEVLRNRLDAIADEMELTLLKSAASPIVKEGLDASAALFNTQRRDHRAGGGDPDPPRRAAVRGPAHSCARSRRSACGTATPSCSTIPTTAARTCPTSPWPCRCSPTAAWWRWRARCATTRTSAAARPGSVPTDATELYQEGVIIPPTQLFRAGELDENLFRLLTRNVRLPDVFTGDLMAQVAAGRLGGLRLRELFARARRGDRAVVHRRAARAGRAPHARRQIEAIPDGDYAFEDWLDDDGVDIGQPVKIAVTAARAGLVDDVRLHRQRPPGARPLQLRAGLDDVGRVLRDARDLRRLDPEQRRLLPRRRRDPARGDAS